MGKKKTADRTKRRKEEETLCDSQESIGYLGSQRDDTERKRFEEALKESEERFRSIFNNIAIGLYRTTPEGDIIMANPALVKMLGFTSFEELMQRDINKEGYAGQYSRIDFIKKIEAEGEIKDFEASWIRKDGSIIFVREHAKKVEDDEGKTLYYEGTVEDITERKHAEEVVKASEERLRALFEASIDGIGVEKDGVFQYFNASLAKLFGFKDVNSFIGKRIESLAIPEDQGKIIEYSKRIERGEHKPDRFDFRGIKRDGTVFDCEASQSSYKMDDETYSVSIFRDVTDRKKVEREIKQRLMKFDLEDGKVYLIKSETLLGAIEVFNDLQKAGYEGLIFSRAPKDQFKYEIKSKHLHVWVSEMEKDLSVQPKSEDILSIIEMLSQRKAILFDCLDYLMSKIGQTKIIELVQKMREITYLNDHIIILSIDPSIFTKRNLMILENECEKIKPMVRAAIPEDLLEILRFVYDQNLIGIKPSYSTIGESLAISKPTVRKRIENLTTDQLLIDKKKGRLKVLEITEKGRILFNK